jgi:hypothetical protein
MNRKLIQLEDGTLVEVEIPPDQVMPISGGFADRVNSTLDAIKPVLIKACRPVIAAWQELNEVNVEQAEMEISFSFEEEGNVYLAKSKSDAHLIVRLVLKSRGSGEVT